MEPAAFIERLVERGVIAGRDVSVESLSGGISSWLWILDDGNNKYVLKCARPELDGADDWFADPARNVSEQDFLLYVKRFLPDFVPRLVYRDQLDSWFVMEYIGEPYVNWKRELMAGRGDLQVCEHLARQLATLHIESYRCEKAAELFDTTPFFYDLRLQPYLIATGNRHPDLEPWFQEEVIRLAGHRESLVHGDFSPKNLMVDEAGEAILLDHEVAWYGDPAFDVAFMLTHLSLKALVHGRDNSQFGELPVRFWTSYKEEVIARHPEPDIDSLNLRTGRLLLMIMMARVDGISPVEYLEIGEKRQVRSFVYEWLPDNKFDVDTILERWVRSVNRSGHEN